MTPGAPEWPRPETVWGRMDGAVTVLGYWLAGAGVAVVAWWVLG